MITTLILWLAIGFPALSLGLLAMNVVDRERRVDRLGDRALIAVWLGLMAASLVLLGVSLAGPLTGITFALVAAIMLLVSLPSRSVRTEMRDIVRMSWRSPMGIGLAIAAVLIAAFATSPVTLYDTGLYHYQNIKWQSSHGLVPGLALIHQRFGFVTSWFSLPAAFEGGVLEGRTTAILGGTVLFLAIAQWLVAIKRWLSGEARSADHFAVLGLGFLLIYMAKLRLLISPSPDVPMLVLPVFIAWTYWLTDGIKLPQIPLLLALGAFAIKLSAAPMLLVTAALGVYRLSTVRPVRVADWLLPSGAAVLTIGVIATASVITTGCGMFPAAFTCLDLPWSVGREAASIMTQVILEWSRWSGPTPADANAVNWLPNWITRNKGFTQMLILFIVAVWIVRRRFHQTGAAIPAIMLSGTGMAYAFVAAPASRFWAGYLFILPGIWFAVIPWLKRTSTPAGRLRAWFEHKGPVLLTTAMVFGLFTAFSQSKILKSVEFQSVKDHWHLPPSIQQPSRLVTVEARAQPEIRSPGLSETTAGYIRYFYPASVDQCWAAPLPCAPSALPSGIRYRDPPRNLAGGFYLETVAMAGNVQD